MCNQRRVAKRPAEFDVMEPSEIKSILNEGAKILQLFPIPLPHDRSTTSDYQPDFGVIYIPNYYSFAEKKVENLDDPKEEYTQNDMKFGL